MEPRAEPTAVRIAPGTRAEIGLVNHTLARVLGVVAGGGPPNVFTTLGRHPSFRRWLRFAGSLMPGGVLRRDETELLILRVAHNCASPYEWQQHARIALTTGLDAADVERVRSGPEAGGWTPRRALLLRAADELHATRAIGDELWAQLRPHFGDEQLIELCLVVGHYEMLAMTLNTLRTPLDVLPAGGPPRVMRGLQALVDRRARR